jgi:hypothetical protein
MANPKYQHRHRIATSDQPRFLWAGISSNALAQQYASNTWMARIQEEDATDGTECSAMIICLAVNVGARNPRHHIETTAMQNNRADGKAYGSSIFDAGRAKLESASSFQEVRP